MEHESSNFYEYNLSKKFIKQIHINAIIYAEFPS
nr:MAG TPA: hypothetical protein [Caudoviricetes sp.]